MSPAASRTLVAAALAVFAAGTLPAQLPQTGGPWSPADIISPAAVSGGGRYHIVVNQGAPGAQQMYYMSCPPSGVMTRMQLIADKTSAAAIAWAPEGLHVFVIESGGRLLRRVLSATTGQWVDSWRSIGDPGFMGRPAATTFKGVVHVFALRAGGEVFTTRGNNASFTGPVAVPGAVSLDSPSATSNTVKLFVTGTSRNSQQALGRMATYDGASWTPWTVISSNGENAPIGPQLVAPHMQDNVVQLASLAAGNAVTVGSTFTSGQFIFQPSEQVAAGSIGYPAFTLWVNGQPSLVKRGTDGKLWIRVVQNNIWSEWSPVAEVK